MEESTQQKNSSDDFKEKGQQYLNEIKEGFRPDEGSSGYKSFLSRFVNLWNSGLVGKVTEIVITVLLLILFFRTIIIIGYIVAMILSLIYFIQVLIKIFKKDTVLGIVGIVIPIFTYIYGWVKAEEFQCKKLMVRWTAFIVLGVVLSIISVSFAANDAYDFHKEQQQKIEKKVDDLLNKYR